MHAAPSPNIRSRPNAPSGVRCAPWRSELGVVVGLAMASAVQATNTISVAPWALAFQGIEMTQATVNSSVAYAARIDLQAPGVRFASSEKRGTLDAQVESTSSFLDRKDAQLAINTGFFTPCCTTQDVDIRGLAASEGSLVSAATTSSIDRSLAQVVTLSQTGTGGTTARIGTTTEIFGTTTVNTQAQLQTAGVWNAFAGSGIIVRDGINTAASHGTFGSPTVVNPRTVVGLSQDARYLFLVAIDGRQDGYSTGVVMDEAADLMLGLGAYIALNVDGGGSTTMARSDGLGRSFLVNRPSNTGNAERLVANSLAVYAIAVPEPGAWLLLLPGLGLVLHLHLRRLRVH